MGVLVAHAYWLLPWQVGARSTVPARLRHGGFPLEVCQRACRLWKDHPRRVCITHVSVDSWAFPPRAGYAGLGSTTV